MPARLVQGAKRGKVGPQAKLYRAPRNKPTALVNMGRGFPAKAKATLKYVDTFYLEASAGPQHRAFSFNGMFDPDYALGGHQPLYYDQYMSLYNHYQVISSKVTISPMTLQSNVMPLRVALWQDDDAIVNGTTPTYYAEKAGIQTQLLSSAQAKATPMSLTWNAKNVFGPNMQKLRASASTNPEEQSYAIISCVPADNGTQTGMFVQLTIEYTALFTELKDVIGS